MTQRTWWQPLGSITARLWLGLGASVLLLAVFSAMIIVRVLSVEEQATQVSQARALDTAARHLELRARGYALAVREYGESGRSQARQTAQREAEDMARQLLEYERLADRHPEADRLLQVGPLWEQMQQLGEAALNGAALDGPALDGATLDAAEHRLGTAESRRMFALRGEIEALLQQVAPPEPGPDRLARRQAALDRLGGIVDTMLLWLVAGAVVALLIIGLVARRLVIGERRLWDSRERLRVTLASIADAVITTDTHGRVTYLNAIAEALTGWDNPQAVGQPLTEVFRIFDGQTRRPLASPAQRLLQKPPGAAADTAPGSAVESLPQHACLIARDGSETPIDDSAAPICDEQGGVTGVILVFRDASGRRRAEEALRQANDTLERRVEARTGEIGRANRFLSALLDNLQEGIVACDAEGVLTLSNRATREFHDLPHEPLAAEHWVEHYRLFCADGQTPMPTGEVPLLRALRGERVRAQEMVIAPTDGPPRWVLANGQAFHDEQGALLGAVVSMQDVTRNRQAESDLRHAYDDLEARVAERTAQLSAANDQLRNEVAVRQQAEERLRASEARKTAMFEAALDCIVSTDDQDRIIEFNAAAERTFGHRRQDVLGRDLPDVLIPPAYRADHRAGMAHYLATGAGPVLNKRLELTALRADGSEFPIELTVTRVPGPGAPTFTAYLRDISESRRAQAALAESQTQWRGIFERLHEGFVLGELVHDEQGKAVDWRYLEMNAGWEDITGLSRAAAQGRTLREVVPGVEPEWVEEFAHVVATGTPANFTRHVAALDRWYEVHAFRAAPGRFAALFLEITERQRTQIRLQESEQRLRFVMDSMPQKIFTARPDGSIDYYSPQWLEYTGLSFEQMRDWGWRQSVHPDDVEENVRVWQHSIDTGVAFDFEQRFLHADGQYRWHISRAVPLRDDAGRIRLWVGSNTDIDEKKRSRDELRQLAAALSEADRRKTEFLAVLAHELRNPLAPLSNAVQILQMAQADPQPGRTVDAAPLIQVMERQVKQMVRLVDDLLDVSRISRGKIGLRQQRVELAMVIDQAVESSRASMQCGGHDLQVMLPAEPVWLHADPLRLVQVFGNLINNACKFTEPGGRIALSAQVEGDEVAVMLQDSGIGIPADQLAAIFEMFIQVDQSLHRHHGGLGIGLTLVRQLVEMHGGTVQVSSEGEGRGSVFVVRLPLAGEYAAAADAALRPPAPRPPRGLPTGV